MRAAWVVLTMGHRPAELRRDIVSIGRATSDTEIVIVANGSIRLSSTCMTSQCASLHPESTSVDRRPLAGRTIWRLTRVGRPPIV